MNLNKDTLKQILFNNIDLIAFMDEDLQKQALEIAIEEDILLLESVWREITENLQRDYLAEMLALDEYGDSFFVASLWCATKMQVQEENPEIFIEIIRQIAIDNEFMEMVMENTSDDLLTNVIHSLLQINNLKYLPISPLLAQKIADSTICNLPIILTLKDASMLPIKQLEQLESSLKIQAIKIGNDEYDIDTYKACRRKIDKILVSIDLQANADNPNREKYIFGQVIRKLAEDIYYDYELFEKEKNGASKNNVESKNARNLIGGLLYGTSVCVGFSEIARNVFACCGIECINIGSGEDDHMWNQINLDDEWFNMDLTWDRKRLVKLQPPQYLLKSDIDFKGHNATFCEKKICSRSIPIDELMKYLYVQQFQINPQHIANIGINFCNQHPGVLQREISKVSNSFSLDKTNAKEI